MGVAVPFFRVELSEAEIAAVEEVLRSGWLTTGARTARFEEDFAVAVGATHALAVNSCTAAMHLALEALGLRPGDGVLVPSMTFAATAEVVRYLGAVPILVDCDPVTLQIDLESAEARLRAFQSGDLPRQGRGSGAEVVGVIPVSVGGLFLDPTPCREFADRHGLWVVDDAAHSFPSSVRTSNGDGVICGSGHADVSCFSFYANKTITTGEGGMAVTERSDLAERMKIMTLHGLSKDAWRRYQTTDSWDYRIVAPGFKYNLTDVAAALGAEQLKRAFELRAARRRIAHIYLEAFAGVSQLELPPDPPGHDASWHLFAIRLCLDRLSIDRNQFIRELAARGISTSVHWRPLHLHPYYQETFDWRPEDLPAAGAVFDRLISLPLFPTMSEEEVDAVIEAVESLCDEHSL